MSTATHHLNGTGITSGRPPATRPRDLVRLPLFDAPQPEGTAQRPDDEVEDHRRVSGARCRIAMGYLD